MADIEVKYENKVVTTIRVTEARSIAKWEKEGWELVSRTPAKLLRTTLAFRRPKKQIAKWVWATVAAAVVLLGIGISAAAINQSSNSANQAKISTTAPSTSSVESPVPATVDASPAATAAPIPVTEVIAAFKSYLAQRASNGVMYAKAAAKVTFENRVVRVTFDPAAAGIDQATFDGLAADFNFSTFLATPIAFNDDLGNRLRPTIDSIQAVRVDGRSLGAIDSAGILALNELSK